MKNKYVYVAFLESDSFDEEREKLFYETYYNQCFSTLEKAKAYGRKCRDEIKQMMKNGEVEFDEDSVITFDIERYDNPQKEDEEIDLNTRCLVFSYKIQGEY